MEPAQARSGTTALPRIRRAGGWLGRAVWSVTRTLIVLWGVLAIYYSNLPWPALRLILALVFGAFGIWALWFARDRRARYLFALVFSIVVLWWISIAPSHDRLWRADVAVMPTATIEGDTVRIRGVRSFDYRSTHDYTVRYEEREVSLAHLTGVDFYISYWMPGPVGHTFLSFMFDNAAPISVSIEIRPEAHEGYAPIASLFRQFELIYVVGDERDIVRVRTNFRGEDVYLYRIRATSDQARELLLIYLERINSLAERPEFYHLLSNSCTINIVRYVRTLGGSRAFNIRHYLNGLFDSYLYMIGRLDTSQPFEELRRRSQINAAAHAADDAPDFSERIRASLPLGPGHIRSGVMSAKKDRVSH